MIDVDEMAAPLAGEHPAGANLEYDPLYLEMDTLAVEVSDSLMGESRVDGRGPDWKKLSKNCAELWKKTRDLRVAAHLVVAEAAMGGLSELVSGFRLLNVLVRDLWDVFYPLLDADDDDNPVERLNILTMLSPDAGSINDPVMFLIRFRETKLIPSLKYTIKDLLIALNELKTAGNTSPDERLLRAELMNAPLAEVQAQADCAHEALELIKTFCAEMDGKMKGGYIVNMDALIHEISRLSKFFDDHLNTFNAPAPSEAGASTAAVAGAASVVEHPPSASAPQAAVSLLSFQPATRAEALLCLRKGAEYFEKQEPNSPIPLLVNRALRFSEMSFIDLIQDIVPDAVSRGREILGIKEES
jgi:type VI secretion system ImpA family protein